MFYNSTTLKTIEIPKEYTALGARMFDGNNAEISCISLESVTFEEGTQITSIDANTFNSYVKIKTFTVPKACTSMPNFTGISTLEEIIFEDNCPNLTSLTSFKGTSIKSIVIPSGIKTLAASTFDGCTSLEKVVFANTSTSSNITKIPDYAFRGCSKLVKVTTLDSNGNELDYNTLPSTCVTINQYAFGYTNIASADAPLITSMTFNSATLTINANAFAGCSKLTYLRVPSGAQYSANTCFANTAIDTVVIYAGTKTTVSRAGNAYASGTAAYTPWYVAGSSRAVDIYIAKGVTAFANYSFYATTAIAANYKFHFEAATFSSTGTNNIGFTSAGSVEYSTSLPEAPKVTVTATEAAVATVEDDKQSTGE
jgi:hypothetical protein